MQSKKHPTIKNLELVSLDFYFRSKDSQSLAILFSKYIFHSESKTPFMTQLLGRQSKCFHVSTKLAICTSSQLIEHGSLLIQESNKIQYGEIEQHFLLPPLEIRPIKFLKFLIVNHKNHYQIRINHNRLCRNHNWVHLTLIQHRRVNSLCHHWIFILNLIHNQVRCHL